MNVSLGEVDAMLRKAARGTGWAWGHAEELGASARALESVKLPGVALGTRLLQHNNRDVCPIHQAALWCDAHHLPDSPAEWVCGLLALPLLARHFCGSGDALHATWSDGLATVDHLGQVQVDDFDIKSEPKIKPTRLSLMPGASAEPRSHFPDGVAVSQTDWQLLEGFALGSYVPASEQSRQGAGPAD